MANKFHTYLVDSIKYESVKEVMKDIDTANLDPDVETIILTITSEGGFLFPAFALYDHIKASKKPVDIIAEGFCMSAAVVIMQAGRKRISRPNTLFMIHPSKNQIQENRLYSEFIAIVEELKRNYELFK
ncbi:MAG TPA: ATP-dependent Clp protease proteolytic subunit, partial [Candidatus Nitrosocosmicus sp.]|nr:ATP-dependent Clp protease proteolytic subunit [Candidatus Nitrosocosmicus sp.]